MEEQIRIGSEYIGKVLPGFFWSRDPNDPRPKDHNLAQPKIGQSCYVLLTSDGLRAALNILNDAAAADAKSHNQPAPVEIAPVAGSDEILKHGYQALTQLNARGFKAAHSLTLAITANRQKFSFASEAAPSQITDERKTGKGISLTYAYIMSSVVLSLGASYEKTFEPDKDVQVCSPIGSAGSTQCTTAALKAPTENDDKLVFVEGRVAFGGLVAISPRVQYKTNDSDVGIALPIYLAKNAQRVLDGGLSLGWTKKDHFAASVFVAKSFQFFD